MATKFSPRSTRPVSLKPGSKSGRKGGGKAGGSGPLLVGAAVAAGLLFFLTRESSAAEATPPPPPPPPPPKKEPTTPTGGTGTKSPGTGGTTSPGTDTTGKTGTGTTPTVPAPPQPGELFSDPAIKNPQAGVQSSPDTQWSYIVKQGDAGPAALAIKILGTDYSMTPTPPPGFTTQQNWYYYVSELIDYNSPPKNTVGKRTAAKSGTPPYNFASYIAGEAIKIPKTWNKYIDQTGRPAGSLKPWPT